MDPVSPAQSRAVHAYADTLLGPEIAGAAAEDALAAFRQALATRGEAAGDPGSPAANETLLALTRLMTAVSMPDRSSPEDRRQAVWASIGSASHCTCRESAALLATRANGNIQARESVALDEHLATCADCRELSVASVTADAAFLEQLKPPAGGGGFGLPGVPRAAIAALAVVIALGAGIVALTSGGSHPSGANAAVPLPVQTQTATAVDLGITTPAPASAVHHRGAVKKKPHHKASTHTTTAAHTTSTTTSTPTTTATAASSAGSADSTPTADTTPAAATPTPASTPSPAQSSPTTASSAAVVSGSSSLPAESAPQQGIGNLTSTTP